MKTTTSCAGARPFELPRQPATFDGYPYLVTRIGHCPLRHMAVLPAEWLRERLVDVTRRQATTNRLDTCLCLSRDDVVYFTAEGRVSEASFVPIGSPVVNRLALVESFPETPELATRRQSLARFAATHNGSGYIVGDGLEGGRRASNEDRERLSGQGAEGTPAGLVRCPKCGRMFGDYLALTGQGNSDLTPRVIEVHCLCDNNNRCAGCGGPLAPERLSAYFWDEAQSKVWYRAAYSALSHRCP